MRIHYRNILAVAGGVVLTLGVISGCLFHENQKYAAENRKLIIQNDSIMSVNIELRHNLQKENAPAKTSSISFQGEANK